MDLHEAEAIMKAVKAYEGIDGGREPYSKAEAGDSLAGGIRMFVEDVAELGGFYTELMEAIGEGDDFADLAEDPYADFQVGRFRVHLVHEGDHYGADGSLVYGDSISRGFPNLGEHENDCWKYGHGLPLVEFYDMEHTAFSPEGQFITRYYLSSLLGMGGAGCDIADMGALGLQGDIPAWTIAGDDLKTVAERLHAVREAYETDGAERPRIDYLEGLCSCCREASEEGRTETERPGAEQGR